MRTKKCDDCGDEVNVDRMATKRASWFVPGKGGRQLRTRTLGTFCNRCVDKDPDYNRRAYESLLPGPSIGEEPEPEPAAT